MKPAEISIAAVPADLAKPGGHYSHAVRAGGFVFVAGQLPVAADGRKLNDEPFEAQTRQVLANVAVGAGCGAGPAAALRLPDRGRGDGAGLIARPVFSCPE